ncbi:MAG TPA: aminotransferase class V-fold PLP-dependent enzyme [Ilumatobacteraceae bacterium]|nr:aminotransferase class V-fold PLP-dependent enzyme [Ilumatobacteraceae bacterium]
MKLDRAAALALDGADPLASWRHEFVIADESIAYLDGNSLGMLPRRTVERLQRVMNTEWAVGLIGSWDQWLDLPQRVGDRLAPLIGAAAGEVAVHDSTTINLYQLVVAGCALRPDRSVIAIDSEEFPTDRYVVDGVAASRGMQVRHGFDRLDDVAVIVRSVVDYRSAEVADVAGETARATDAGAIALWDLSHAVGVLPVDLRGAGAQLAVGCTYKYLNGGPGAPAFSFVAKELQATLTQPIWGWFAQTDQFTMGSRFVPQPDIRRVLAGTPSVLALAAADEGIALTVEAGISAIATKARRLTGFAIDLCDQFGLVTSSPRDADRRGGHVAVVHPNARQMVTTLASRRVLVDYREPDVVRLGCSPLTTRFVDVFDGLHCIADLV